MVEKMNNVKTGHFTSFDDSQIYYNLINSHSEREFVTFIHGQSGGNFSMLQHQIEYVAKNYNVLAFDLRGGGRSELAGKRENFYSLENFARDTIGLMEYFDINKAHLIGYSLGTTIALKVFDMKPDIVDSLILLHPAYNLLGNTSLRNQIIVHSGLCSFLENSISYTSALINRLRGVNKRTVFDYSNINGMNSYINFSFLVSRTPEELMSRLQLVRNRIKWNVEEIIDKIDVPLLCISGDKDIWIDPSAAEEIVQRARVDSEAIIIKGNGHGAVYLNPEQITKEVLNFLEKQTKPLKDLERLVGEKKEVSKKAGSL